MNSPTHTRPRHIQNWISNAEDLIKAMDLFPRNQSGSVEFNSKILELMNEYNTHSMDREPNRRLRTDAEDLYRRLEDYQSHYLMGTRVNAQIMPRRQRTRRRRGQRGGSTSPGRVNIESWIREADEIVDRIREERQVSEQTIGRLADEYYRHLIDWRSSPHKPRARELYDELVRYMHYLRLRELRNRQDGGRKRQTQRRRRRGTR